MACRTLLLAACLAAAGCSGSADDRGGAGGGYGTAPLARYGDALDVYEAAFRHQLKQFPCAPEAAAHLSIDGRDIPIVLMNRLRRDWPNLKQLSEGEKDKVLRVYADGLTREGNDATVRVGYWFPTKYAGQSEFGDVRLVRKAGRWVVESISNITVGCG